MKYLLVILLFSFIIIFPISIEAQSTKQITYVLRTYSDSAGESISHPLISDTDILLPAEIAKEYTCKVLKKDIGTSKIGGANEYRTLTCFHKDQKGYYDGAVFNSAQCYLDGVKRGTELTHLTVVVFIPDANHDPKNTKMISMSMDLMCEAK